MPPGPYQLADLGGDVLALLDLLGAQRAHLAGVSLGGMVAMWVAAHAPDRVDRLALFYTSARLGPPEAWAARASAVRAGGLEAIADTVLHRWTPAEFARENPHTVAELRRMLLATDPDGYASACAAIETMNLEPDIGRITAPTLVLGGLDDEAIPPAHARRIATGITGARLALVPTTAHLAPVSRPQLVGQLLADFLSGDDRPDGVTMTTTDPDHT